MNRKVLNGKDRSVSVGVVLTDKEKANSNGRYRIVFVSAIVILVLCFVLSLSLGRYAIPFDEVCRILFSNVVPLDQTWTVAEYNVVFTLRMPRTIAAILIGAALSLSGACYQSIFKNPMVSPDLLGVSAGACVGAATAILLGLDSLWIQIFAFVMGIITVFVTTLMPRLIRNDSTIVLVLSGVIVSSLMSSIMSLIKFVADTDTQLAEITYWTMGSFSAITYDDILSVLPFLVIPAIAIIALRFRLNVMALGDREARTLGVNLRATRNVFILCSTLLTASCVCLAGTVGWVGLVIPHISRLIVGVDNKKMLPIAMLFGASFMLVIDLICRTLTGADLKISIITGLVGAPFFFFILFKQHKSMSM